MARYTATVTSDLPVVEVFARLSDFSTTEQWDPGVVEASRLDDGPIGVGSRFHVVAQQLGRTTPLTYEIVAIDVPRSVTLRGENATVVSLDTITFEPRAGGGTIVAYDADLVLKGPLRVFELGLRLVFGRIGDRAVEGLQEYLAE